MLIQIANKQIHISSFPFSSCIKPMQIQTKISTIYECSLERSFKTPMLCDVTKVHTGYGLMPRITHCTDDEHWGQPGSTKKAYAAKSLTQAGGYASLDKVLERIDNKYWKIEVSDFQAWMLGFYKFEGEWETTAINENKTRIDYTYTMYFKGMLWYPFCWLFTKLFWRTYMRRVLENVKQLAYSEERYMYE